MGTAERADVVVIGAGISGCASAWHLLHRDPSLRVVLLESHQVGAGSTSRSNAAFRHQWSVPVHAAFSRYSAAEYADLAGRGHPVGFTPNGYLFLFTEEEAFQQAAERARRQRQSGMEGIRALRPEQVPDEVPGGDLLELEGLAGAVWGLRDGFLDPMGVTQAYLEEGRAAGLDYRQGVRAVSLVREGGRVTGVVTGEGSTVAGSRVLLAAGVWSASLMRSWRLGLPVRPAKRYLYHTRPVRGREVSDWPLIVGERGAHLRPSEGNTLLLAWESRPDPEEDVPNGGTLRDRQDAVEEGFGTGPEGYGMEVLAELAPHMPLLAEEAALAGVTSGWYCVTGDHKAILSADPRLEGLYHACGFSGHGIMHGAATGRTMAELVLGEPTSLARFEEIRRHFGLQPLLEGKTREPGEDVVI
ncbi:MAG: FAD-binding oxidoreductase [bacterium]